DLHGRTQVVTPGTPVLFPGPCSVDTVAMAMVKNMTQFNGAHGCAWCEHMGLRWNRDRLCPPPWSRSPPQTAEKDVPRPRWERLGIHVADRAATERPGDAVECLARLRSSLVPLGLSEDVEPRGLSAVLGGPGSDYVRGRHDDPGDGAHVDLQPGTPATAATAPFLARHGDLGDADPRPECPTVTAKTAKMLTTMTLRASWSATWWLLANPSKGTGGLQSNKKARHPWPLLSASIRCHGAGEQDPGRPGFKSFQSGNDEPAERRKSNGGKVAVF
ncbi:hypothetical protein HPB47_010396, partial [Ixodes persulcatus]